MATKPELTRSEKLAGRRFVADMQAILVASHLTDPPDFKVMPWHKIFRHSCEKRGGVSTALELHEVYLFSTRYAVIDEQVVEPLTDDQEVGGSLRYEVIPAGRFGFIYKQGHCRGCGKTARSRTGHLVDAHQRPPLEGRIAR